VGRRETFAQVQQLLSGSKLLRNQCYVESEGDINGSLSDSVLTDVKAIIFDTELFSYDDILDWMYARASEGKRYSLGLYSSQTGKLITEEEVL